MTPLTSKKIQLDIGGQKTDVEYKDLWGVVFLLGDEEHQDQMMPTQKKEMMVFSRKHQIMLQKDMKQGETVSVWCEVNVPLIVVESIVEENGAKILFKSPEVVPSERES